MVLPTRAQWIGGRKDKAMNTSKQRFVKEYANFKINVLTSLMKNFPEKTVLLTANIVVIKRIVRDWERSLVTTDEAMRRISEF